MFCKYCGSENSETAVFCQLCGKAQQQVAPPLSGDQAILSEAILSEAHPSETEEDETKKTTKTTASTKLGQNLIKGAGKLDAVVATPIVQQNPGLLLAMAGSLLALFAFCFLPYITITSLLGTPVSLIGAQLASMNSINALLPGVEHVWLLWLEPVIAVVIICMAGYTLFKRSEQHLSPPIERRLIMAIKVIAGATLVILVIKFTADLQPIVNIQTATVSASIASLYGIGVWVYYIGILVAFLGGFVQYNKK